MIDLTSLNKEEPNLTAAKLLSQIGWSLQKNQLASAQLMLWALDENKIDQVPAWAEVTNFSDRHWTWERLIEDLEKNNPQLLMQYLTESDEGEELLPNLEESDSPQTGADVLLNHLTSAIQAKPLRV